MKYLGCLLLAFCLTLASCKKVRDITGPAARSGTGGTSGGGTGGTDSTAAKPGGPIPQVTGLSIIKTQCSKVGGASTGQICVYTISAKTIILVETGQKPSFPTNLTLTATGGSVPTQVATSAPNGVAVFTWSFGAGKTGSFSLTACVINTKSCASLEISVK